MTPGLSGEKPGAWAATLGPDRKLLGGASNNPNAQGDNFFAIYGMPFGQSQTMQIFSCEVKGIGSNCPMLPQQSWAY